MANKFNEVVGSFMLKFFAIFGMLGSIILLITFISDAIELNEYHQLFGMCLPFGMFLGANSLLKNTQNNEERLPT